MLPSLHELLLATNSLLHVSTTGAGLRLQTALWDTPGASAYVVGFFMPYAKTQLHSFLGHSPEDSYCSRDVAFDLAMASFIRAAEHRVVEGLSGIPLGVGVTASVASTRMPHGEHRAHVVLMTQYAMKHFVIELEKGVGKETRVAHDDTIASVVVRELSRFLAGGADAGSKRDTETAFDRFYRYPIFETNGTRHPKSDSEGGLYLPATLNPIHDGHRTMCQLAESHLNPGAPRARFARYLVSSSSPHKGKLSVQEMLMKAGMLRAERWRDESRMVEFTYDEPLFIDKARKRPGAVFVIGVDTMVRMLDPRWGTNIADMLDEMQRLKVSFLVMGRQIDGKYTTCTDLSVPWPHQNLFHPIEGRVDISSSELRTAGSQ